ncbi:AIM24 family protein [Nocardia australiensis]|uniref:AIM24 family protein n=1 Tax=Nocardia australiensis TaxID=2887191 RepID=UPI001D13AB44|nr:AIM24 family protein [Nocardia australiensis]
MAQLFEHSKKVIEAHLVGTSIRAISGSMIAYEGNVQFKTAGFGGGDGVLAGLKRRATGEKLSLMECNGHGRVFFAVNGQHVTVVDLADETLQVESQQLLAFAGNLRTDVRFAGVGSGAATGAGLFTTTVTGQGQVALLSAGGPLIHLEVSPQYPLVVDPDAFVAAHGNINHSFVTDVSWRSFVGQDAGEAFSLRWDGQGVVLIQPAER